MRSRMLFAVVAAFGIQVALAYHDGFDLATLDQASSVGAVLQLQPYSSIQTWTLSSDKDLSNYDLELSPHDNGGGPATAILDMAAGGNHTLKLYAWHTRPPSYSPDILVRGGVVDFSGSTKGDGRVTLLGWGSNWYANPESPVYDGVTFEKLWKTLLHSGLPGSTLVLTGGTAIKALSVPEGGFLTIVDYAFESSGTLKTTAGAVRFETGAKLISNLAEICVDNSHGLGSDAAPDVETRASVPVTFTGGGTMLNTGTLRLGAGVPGQRLVLADHATGVCAGSGLQLGTHALGWGRGAELNVTGHAVLTNRAGITIGTVRGNDGCSLIASDGAELVAQGTDNVYRNLYVGWMSNDNEFVLSNATLRAAMVLFGYQGSDHNCVTGNVARFVGQDTQIILTSAWSPFASSYNTLVFDDVTYQKRGMGIGLNFWNTPTEAQSNNTVRIEHGAKLAIANVLMGRQGGGTDSASCPVACNESTFELLNSELELDSQFHQSGRDCTVVVSNGLLTVSAKGGFDMAVSNAAWTTHSVAGNKVCLLGRAPRICCLANGGHIRFYDAHVSFDVSDAPTDGYGQPVLQADEISFSADRVSLVGADKLRRRLLDAGVHRANFVLAKAVTALTVGTANLAAINVDLAAHAPGFRLEKNPAFLPGGLVLTYSDLAFAVPPDSEWANPQFPYDSWATGATSIRDASLALGPYGVLKLLGGTYAAASAGVNPANAISLRVYADTDETCPGELTIVQRIFGGELEVIDDPTANTFRFEYGTCHLNHADSSSNFFVEFATGEATVGRWTRCRAIFAGENVRVDSDAGAFYVGYQSKGTEMVFADGAIGTIPCGVRIGGNEMAEGSALSVLNGANVSVAGTMTVGEYSDGNRVVVSNATLNVRSVAIKIGNVGAAANGLELQGDAPVVCSAAENGSIAVGSGGVVRIDVAAVPIAGYEMPPLSAGTIEFAAGSVLCLTGLDTLLARIREAGVERERITLMIARKGAAFNLIDDDVLAATQSTLPAEFTLKKVGGVLKLTYGPPQGALLIVR